MDRYALQKLTNWTPQLSPPPDSPLYRWRLLAGEVPLPAPAPGTLAQLTTGFELQQ
jgi:hypothetical protein